MIVLLTDFVVTEANKRAAKFGPILNLTSVREEVGYKSLIRFLLFLVFLMQFYKYNYIRYAAALLYYIVLISRKERRVGIEWKRKGF